ncbi:MAG: hypothetical protein ACI8RD_012111 [Bacillariaceae sp.]|jgi:hypothetical protein
MPLQYNPKTMPLRRSPSGTTLQTGGGERRLFCLGKIWCYGFITIVFFIGTTLYNDRGMRRSLSQPMIRKSTNYLTYLADTDAGAGDQPRNSERIKPKPKNNDIPETVQVNINEKNKNIVDVPEKNESIEDDSDSKIPDIVQAVDISEKIENTANVSDKNENIEDDVDNEKDVDKVQTMKGKKPHLFLHVGPQKTASSTLQSTLDKLSSLTHELKDDNFYYMHIAPEAGDFDCETDHWGGFHNCKASDKLKSLIRKTRDEGKNLLLTDENLDENFVKGLRDAIDDDDWNVTVIVMYRRIHEWLLSWYNQINKTTNIDSKGDVLFNDEGVPYRTEHKHWPDHGGIRVPNFSTWYKEYTRYWKPTELVDMHRSIKFYNLYNESFKNDVRLYNMHNEGDLVTDFICNIIGATNACKKYQNNLEVYEIKENNSSIDLDHDIVAVHAYEQGHIDKTLTRTGVSEAVTTYIKESGKIIPRKCEPEVTDQIRNWLVDSEKVMSGDQNWSKIKEDELLQVYESYTTKGKLCDVDKDAILLDQDWLHFFHSLKGRERRNIVLHVGPVGADTIYETLTTIPRHVEGLQKDNYTVVNIDIHGDHHFDCTQRESSLPNCVASPKLKSMISSLEETEKNVIISNDNLDERFVEAFKNAIDGTKWKIKIVVGYIRLNQLLLMMYENEYNYENLDPNGHFMIGQNNNPNRIKHSSWPDEGGVRIPGFNDWFNAFSQESEVSKIEHISMHLRDRYISSFDEVNFYPYHELADLEKNFVCKIVPGAIQTCESAKNSEKNTNEVSSLSTEYTDGDILAVNAYEKGLIKKGLDREHVADAIRNRLRSTGKNLARVCVSEVTKKLYDWMIDSEKSMLGSRWSSKRIAGINIDFQSFLESGKLCALDVEKELQNESWIAFFRSLN